MRSGKEAFNIFNPHIAEPKILKESDAHNYLNLNGEPFKRLWISK